MPYYPKKRSYKGKRPYKKRAYRRKARPSSKKSFAARVKKIIHSQLENKTLAYYEANKAIPFAGSLTTPLYYTLTPTISNGNLVSQRIGNEVMIRKGSIKGYINLLPYNAVTNQLNCPVYVKMWMCSRKITNVGISGYPTSSDWANFFQSGAVSLGFQSNMLDLCFRPNRDYWNIYATKTFQFNIVNNTASAAIIPASGNVSVPFYFNFSKHLKKLKFNDSVNIPTNRELFLAFQTVLGDGSTPVSGSFAEVHSVTEWEFEDA